MITSTFYAPTKLGRKIQDQVKQHGGWFESNPLEMFNEKSQFVISFDDGSNYRKFSACTQIIQQPWF